MAKEEEKVSVAKAVKLEPAKESAEVVAQLRNLVGMPIEKMLDSLRRAVVGVFEELQEKSGKSLDEWRDKLLLLIKSEHEANQQRLDADDLRKCMAKLAKMNVNADEKKDDK